MQLPINLNQSLVVKPPPRMPNSSRRSPFQAAACDSGLQLANPAAHESKPRDVAPPPALTSSGPALSSRLACSARPGLQLHLRSSMLRPPRFAAAPCVRARERATALTPFKWDDVVRLFFWDGLVPASERIFPSALPLSNQTPSGAEPLHPIYSRPADQTLPKTIQMCNNILTF
jgi:hypothetical protein